MSDALADAQMIASRQMTRAVIGLRLAVRTAAARHRMNPALAAASPQEGEVPVPAVGRVAGPSVLPADRGCRLMATDRRLERTGHSTGARRRDGGQVPMRPCAERQAGRTDRLARDAGGLTAQTPVSERVRVTDLRLPARIG